MSDCAWFSLQESEVANIEAGVGALTFRFSAAHIRRTIDGVEQSGFIQGMVMTCWHPNVVELDDACFGTLGAGCLQMNGEEHRQRLPVSFESAEQGVLTLAFANGARCAVAFKGVEWQPTPPARWVEWLHC